MVQLTFNMVLQQAGLNPEDVILLRHQEQQVRGGLTPYLLWRDNRPAFEEYQSLQSVSSRKMFSKPYWASFVATPSGETVFVGLYSARILGELKEDVQSPLGVALLKAGESDWYELTLDERLSELSGRLVINWGASFIAWRQYAGKQDKPIIELRKEFSEPEFPGLMNFIEPLSRILQLPTTWVEVLKNTKGVYLLTCPRTKELYVGSASGADGFYGRWLQYATNGHGDVVKLKSREPSDYQVCVLEIAGSALETRDIIGLEQKWKRRLRTGEMGLTSN